MLGLFFSCQGFIAVSYMWTGRVSWVLTMHITRLYPSLRLCVMLLICFRFLLCVWPSSARHGQLNSHLPSNSVFLRCRDYCRATKGIDAPAAQLTVDKNMESPRGRPPVWTKTEPNSGMQKVSESSILTGTNPPPHTFAAERSSSPSPCPPLRRIPPSWSDPAVGPSPFFPSPASF